MWDTNNEELMTQLRSDIRAHISHIPRGREQALGRSFCLLLETAYSFSYDLI
jgi:hypothetical protein